MSFSAAGGWVAADGPEDEGQQFWLHGVHYAVRAPFTLTMPVKGVCILVIKTMGSAAGERVAADGLVTPKSRIEAQKK